MLQNDLYTCQLLLSENDRITARIRLVPTHWIFHAHFPSYPVVPAAVWAQIGQELLPVSQPITQLRNARFLHVLQPDGQTELEMQATFIDGVWRVSFADNDRTYCKLEYRYG